MCDDFAMVQGDGYLTFTHNHNHPKAVPVYRPIYGWMYGNENVKTCILEIHPCFFRLVSKFIIWGSGVPVFTHADKHVVQTLPSTVIS